MATPLFDTAVLVLNTKAADALRAGAVACALYGVCAVTADPARGQVIVRYDPEKVGSASIRDSVRVPPDVAVLGPFWIHVLPKLARALPAVASML